MMCKYYYKGEPLVKYCERIGLNYPTVYHIMINNNVTIEEALIHAKKNKGNKSHPKIFVGDVPFVDYLEKNYSHPIKAYHIAIELRKQKQPLEYILERLEKYR